MAGDLLCLDTALLTVVVDQTLLKEAGPLHNNNPCVGMVGFPPGPNVGIAPRNEEWLLLRAVGVHELPLGKLLAHTVLVLELHVLKLIAPPPPAPAPSRATAPRQGPSVGSDSSLS